MNLSRVPPWRKITSTIRPNTSLSRCTTSAGERFSDSAVKPRRSPKSTVTSAWVASIRSPPSPWLISSSTTSACMYCSSFLRSSCCCRFCSRCSNRSSATAVNSAIAEAISVCGGPNDITRCVSRYRAPRTRFCRHSGAQITETDSIRLGRSVACRSSPVSLQHMVCREVIAIPSSVRLTGRRSAWGLMLRCTRVRNSFVSGVQSSTATESASM